MCPFCNVNADNRYLSFLNQASLGILFEAKLNGSYTSGLSAARILPNLRNLDGDGNENVKQSTPVWL